MKDHKIITPNRDKMIPYLVKVWQARFLILTLTRRDIKAKYAQTYLGPVWALIQPVTGLLIYTVFFHLILGINSGGVPYPLFVFSGIVVWYFFANIISTSSNCLLQNRDLIEKISFPKIIILIAKTLAASADLIVSLFLLFIMMLFWQVQWSLHILLLPVIIVMVGLCGLAIGIWMAALTVKYRDLQHVVPYLIYHGIWLTPVFYPVLIIPEHYHDMVYFLNPLASSVEWVRWILFGEVYPDPRYLISFVPVLVLFLVGLRYFVGMEREIVDYA